MKARSLQQWLEFIERQHPQSIALGLERVGAVWERMETALACPIVTVGGTNGKGSTSATIESILRAAGYRVGLYTSPHLMRYNERVRVCGEDAGDAQLCEAFGVVERARGAVALTYFEYGTLAAAWIFAHSNLDAVVLEVGLGGRLDAVNLFDADCAVLTSVALDHVEYLGNTRESIGREKSGIFRLARPAVVADPDPPQTVLQEAKRIGARVIRYGIDFGYRRHDGQWSCWGPSGSRGGLAHPALRGATQLRNAAAALTALESLRDRLPVAMQDVRRGLANVRLPGRFQVLPGRPQVILDVAHNPEAAEILAKNVAASGDAPQTIAVFAMLRDKDVVGVSRAIASGISRWHVAGIAGPRGASGAELAATMVQAGVSAPIVVHAKTAEALAAAQGEAGEDDKILVFGSFLTVAEAMASLIPRGDG